MEEKVLNVILVSFVQKNVVSCCPHPSQPVLILPRVIRISYMLKIDVARMICKMDRH